MMRRITRRVRHWRYRTPTREIVLTLVVAVAAIAAVVGLAVYLGAV